ncbi:MAG TPA: C1 family peptidase, partial [Anaerolineales bacterium]|nr:C1 family peptidase [Anaerolineales bacterium]
TRYWNASGWWGDQNGFQSCVGFAWTAWVEDGPITHKPKGAKTPPLYDPAFLYAEAQKVDEWEGAEPAYFGTSVRAGAKVLKTLGLISEYRWTWDVNDVIDALLYIGPVVVGTNFYESMLTPDENGLWGIAGPVIGGHAYVLNGISQPKNLIRIKNSWSRGWGKNGFAYIMPHDLQRLLNEDGECALATEIAT